LAGSTAHAQNVGPSRSPMQELPKHYDHKAAQARCRQIWDAGRFWHAEPPAPGERDPSPRRGSWHGRL
jgi:hypothetical protein